MKRYWCGVMEHWLMKNGGKCMCVKRERESRVEHLLRNYGETGEWRECCSGGRGFDEGREYYVVW